MISIVIPTYNEAANITTLLKHLLKASKQYVCEIIISDGGSTDNTLSVVSDFIKERSQPTNYYSNTQFKNDYSQVQIYTISSPKGRSKQMNAAAKMTNTNILYFLHADTFPPIGFDVLIYNEVQNNNLAGCFKMKFDHSHWWLKLAGQLTCLNILAARGGDQSLFITKTLFNKLNGFNENFIIYEDNDLIKQLYKQKAFTVIRKKPIITSARRYKKNGIWRLQYHFFVIHLKKRFGASPAKLYNYYKTNIR